MNTFKENKNIEDKIAKQIADKDKNYSNHEIERLIKKEIKKEGYLEEDWQVKHAVKRIKSKINRRLVGGKILFNIRDLMEDQFNIFTVQYYDVLIADDKIFLIKIPKEYLRLIGLIVGLILGAAIGAQIEKYNRSKYRRKWMDDGEIYIKEDINLEIPRNKMKKNTTFSKKKVKFNYNNKEVRLKGKKKKIEKLRDLIN